MKNYLNSLTSVIVLPFLLLTLSSIGFVAIFSSWNTQNAINKVVKNLSQKVSEQTNKTIKLYLINPHLVNQLNADSYRLSNIKLDNQEKLEKHFSRQLQSFRSGDSEKTEKASELINNIYFANKNKDFVGVAYKKNINAQVVTRSNEKTKYIYLTYVVDEDGNASTEPLPLANDSSNKEYDPTNRPWYKKAVKSKGAIWSDFYIDRSTQMPTITATLPIRNNGELIGVFGSDLLLTEINSFLTELVRKISPNTLIFIVDSQGRLITTSKDWTEYKTYVDLQYSDNLEFIQAKDVGKFYERNKLAATDQLIDFAATSKLIASITKEYPVESEKSCELYDDNKTKMINVSKETYFLSSLNIKDNYTLNWCIFVAIPQSDFMKDIKSETWNTIIIYGFVLIGTTILIVIMAHKIAQPILKLADSAKSLSESLKNSTSNIENNHLSEPKVLTSAFNTMESFTPSIEIKHPSELNILTIAFNTMGIQLNEYLKQLQVSNENLAKSIENLDIQKTELEKINKAYSLFIPQKFSEIIGKKITELELGDSIEARMSILFSDIRDFTNLSEDMSPEDNFKFINDYLRRMEPAISENNGFIDKYVGDAIMAIFDHNKIKISRSSNNAIKAGISMLTRLREYNEERKKENLISIKIGIGIHTGNLKLGTVGGENRMDTTVISKNVNLASRLESLTKQFGVSFLVSEETLLDVSQTERKEYSYRRLAPVMPKGISNFVRIYEIFNTDEPNIKECKIAHNDRFNQAIDFYEAEQFELARQIFEEITEACPEDGVADFYKKCCEQKQSYKDMTWKVSASKHP
jgi:adenylate cyclase